MTFKKTISKTLHKNIYMSKNFPLTYNSSFQEISSDCYASFENVKVGDKTYKNLLPILGKMIMYLIKSDYKIKNEIN